MSGILKHKEYKACGICHTPFSMVVYIKTIFGGMAYDNI